MRLSILFVGVWFILWGMTSFGWISLLPWILPLIAIVGGVLLIADNWYTVKLPRPAFHRTIE